jgi:hypothetical protein
MSDAIPSQLRFPAIAGFSVRAEFDGLTDPTPDLLYQDLYCARGQDENFIKAVKNDLASDHAFLANHLRLFYACAAYVLIHSLRDKTPWSIPNWPVRSRCRSS